MAVNLGINNGEFGYLDLTQEQQMMMIPPSVLDHHQHQQQGFQFHYQNGPFSYPSTSSIGAEIGSRLDFSQSLGSLLENQRQELGLFLQIQNEGFVKSLVQRYEPYVNTLMSQKEEMITNAIKKRSTLEGYLRNMETEVATWQVKAQESEVKIAELNNALNQLGNNGDEGSQCDSSQSQSQSGDDTCKMCGVRRSCVVFLPCRHLCSCKFCEDFVGVCPVCKSVKESSVEVLF